MSSPTKESTRVTEPAVTSEVPIASTQVLITEQEVLAGTAAAAGLRSTSRWSLIAALRHLFARSQRAPRAPRAPRQHYPRRASYLDGPRMARAMERL
jgi:hypothetical protein